MRSRLPLLALPLALAALAPDARAAEPQRTAPPDTRSGHFYLAPSVGFARPSGTAEAGVPQFDRAAWGTSYGGQLGLGISRYVIVGGYGEVVRFGAPATCESCSGHGFTAGAFAQYHLIDHSPFDPWVSYGVGWRSTTFATPAGDVTYSGVDFAHLGFGGDWYPTPLVGFGPYLTFDFGRYSARTPGTIGDGALHSFIGVGLRVVVAP